MREHKYCTGMGPDEEAYRRHPYCNGEDILVRVSARGGEKEALAPYPWQCACAQRRNMGI